ncbi:synaptosomal-associated protein 23-like [Cyprinus carpio]|uniref:Synaptosomal-associated protein n=1 Tax=Cyprinus carpio TaxID=7962 RepID=A0A9Q9XB14_CYPCA|nr:synaptosomal-associated protein 23-like [Cyprinus carpio]
MADMSVEEMKIKANDVTNESLESTRRMLQMTEESLNVGVKTMTMLEEQGEQLKNVDREMDQISQDMKQARKNLNELSKCCGLCLCPCNRVTGEKSKGKKQRKKAKESKQKVVSIQPTAVRNGQAVSAGSAAPTGPYIKRVTNDAREDEMEENLGQVGSIIENLKTLALDMGNEIDKQNKSIDRITDKADMNIAHTDEASQRANQIR